jgi:glycosyltransferase involved in cell wall biosynthesis
MRTAVIVTTYNRADALKAVINSYMTQSDLNFELIVADDGSTEETREVILRYQKHAPFPIKHIWHEDKGFRAAAIRNRAILASKADYIIFTDGDCIPLNTFVARHKKLAEPGWFVAGNRVLLSPSFTQQILHEKISFSNWKITNWLKARLFGHINRLSPLVRLPLFRHIQPNRWQGVKTCNLAIWYSDLIHVNGLDESYAGWGMEDSDLVIRLIHAGIHHKSGRYAAPVLHLWHQENDRSALQENILKLNQVMKSARTDAETGLNQYT